MKTVNRNKSYYNSDQVVYSMMRVISFLTLLLLWNTGWSQYYRTKANQFHIQVIPIDLEYDAQHTFQAKPAARIVYQRDFRWWLELRGAYFGLSARSGDLKNAIHLPGTSYNKAYDLGATLKFKVLQRKKPAQKLGMKEIESSFRRKVPLTDSKLISVRLGAEYGMGSLLPGEWQVYNQESTTELTLANNEFFLFQEYGHPFAGVEYALLGRGDSKEDALGKAIEFAMLSVYADYFYSLIYELEDITVNDVTYSSVYKQDFLAMGGRLGLKYERNYRFSWFIGIEAGLRPGYGAIQDKINASLKYGLGLSL